MTQFLCYFNKVVFYCDIYMHACMPGDIWITTYTSLMKIKKSKGPSTDSWGTPERTGRIEELVPSTTTSWDLLDIGSCSPIGLCRDWAECLQASEVMDDGGCCRMLFEGQNRQNRYIFVSWPWSRWLSQSWVTDSSAEVDDQPGRKPHCFVEMGRLRHRCLKTTRY